MGDQVRCHNCNEENQKNRSTCGQCGAPLSKKTEGQKLWQRRRALLSLFVIPAVGMMWLWLLLIVVFPQYREDVDGVLNNPILAASMVALLAICGLLMTKKPELMLLGGAGFFIFIGSVVLTTSLAPNPTNPWAGIEVRLPEPPEPRLLELPPEAHLTLGGADIHTTPAEARELGVEIEFKDEEVQSLSAATLEANGRVVAAVGESFPGTDKFYTHPSVEGLRKQGYRLTLLQSGGGYRSEWGKIAEIKLTRVPPAPNQGHEGLFAWAAAHGDLDTAGKLLEEYPELVHQRYGSDEHTALHIAVGLQDYAMTKLLLDAGADPTACRRNYFSEAGFQAMQDSGLVGLMVRKATPDEKSWVLGKAASAGALETARLLLNEGASPDGYKKADYTPLHSATNNRDLPMMKLLLHAGANPNARLSRSLQTPLHLALARGRAANEPPPDCAVIALLLRSGASPWSRMKNGQSPVDLANIEILQTARMLAEREAPIDALMPAGR